MKGKACSPGGPTFCALPAECNNVTGCCIPNPSDKLVYVEADKVSEMTAPATSAPSGPATGAPTGSPICPNCTSAPSAPAPPTVSPSATASDDDDRSMPLMAEIAIFFVTYAGLVLGLIFGIRKARSMGYLKTGTMADKFNDAKQGLVAAAR
eukprot:TRINITY_DN35089_c0_g1_i2.p1 TRINITY_DN35089_c0_g1~~TRINITY_DN35089_c0_g1_i2.p1  ORF type:complete len:152 (+),score=38.50 TRINITY_DN35089_c0_g1_i2:289-744(+)